MPKIVVYLFVLILFLLFHPPVFAAQLGHPENVPSEIHINDSFSFDIQLSGVQPGQTYFFKCRIGSSSSLSEGETYNSSTEKWLTDTGTTGQWVDMPTIQAAGDSIIFSIQCRVKSGKDPGEKVIFARACLKKEDGICGTSFPSATSATFTALAEPSPSPTPTPQSSTSQSSSSTSTKAKSQSPSPKNSPSTGTSKTSSQKTSSVLGSSSSEATKSPTLEVNLSASPTPSVEPKAEESSNKMKIAGTVAGSGAIIMGISVGLYLWYRKRLATGDKNKEQT